MMAHRLMPRWNWLGCLLAFAVTVLLPSVASAQLTESPIGRKIADIIPLNNKVRSTNHILAKMTLKPGAAFDERVASDDVARLLASGWFAPNGVELKTSINSEGEVTIWLEVRELQQTVKLIQFTGLEHYTETALLDLLRVRKGAPMNPAVNRQSAAAITAKMREDGRYYATCTLTSGKYANDEIVTFDIVEGPVVRLQKVEFRGNSGEFETGNGRLKTIVKSRGALFGTPTIITGKFTPMALETDRKLLLNHYHQLGYLDCVIDHEVEPTSFDLSTVKVTYHIYEGKPYTVRNVRFEGNKVYEEKKLLAFTLQKAGKLYDESLVQADSQLVQNYYGQGGYRVQVIPEPFAVPDKPNVVDVCYRVLEPSRDNGGPVTSNANSRGQAPVQPDRVGRIWIVGNKYTRQRVILNQLRGVEPGQVLDYSKLKMAEDNLRRLGIFDAESPPSIEVDPSTQDKEYKDLVVRVQEMQTGQAGIQVGVNSNAGVSGTLSLNQRNFDIAKVPRSLDDILEGKAFRGNGQEFRLTAMPGQVFQRYEATWRDPYLFDSRFGLTTNFYYASRAFTEYNENRYGTRLTLDYQFQDNPFWRANLSTRVEGVDVNSLPFDAPPSITRDAGKHFLLGLRAGASRDTRDSFLMPTTGSLLDFGVEQILGSYQFQIGTAEYTKFWTVHQARDGGWKGVFALRSQLAVMGDNAPVFERVFAGGFKSMRGFQFRGVGPTEGNYHTGGTFSFLNTLEYQLPLVANERIRFVTFCDHGTVNNRVSFDNYRVSVGVGLRIQVPALGPLPIALDFGFPVVKGAGDRTEMFSFYLGWIGGQ
jgi:outer membrane protein insertion porin family